MRQINRHKDSNPSESLFEYAIKTCVTRRKSGPKKFSDTETDGKAVKFTRVGSSRRIGSRYTGFSTTFAQEVQSATQAAVSVQWWSDCESLLICSTWASPPAWTHRTRVSVPPRTEFQINNKVKMPVSNICTKLESKAFDAQLVNTGIILLVLEGRNF